MKLILVNDYRLYLGQDGRWYSGFDYAIEYILKHLPEINEFIIWGRLQRTEKTEGKFLFPSQVGNCKLRVAGPMLKSQRISQWPLLLIKNFFALKKEIAKADIVFLRMPQNFSCMAFQLVKKDQIVISQQVGDAAGTIPLMIPRLKVLAPLIAKYCKKIASRADRAFFVSNALRDIYGNVQRGDIVCNESRVTKDMIVSDYSSDIHKPPRVIYVGRLSAEKGLSVLLEAIAKVIKKIRVELWIIGAGPLRNEMEDLADKLGISENLKWFGWLRWGPQLFEKIGQADTLVLPSFSEGLGLVLVEAMSQGLVVVASSVGGIPEILKNGRAGILIPPGNVRELSKAIKLSVTDTSLRDKMITLGLKQTQEHCLEEETGKLVAGIAAVIRQDK